MLREPITINPRIVEEIVAREEAEFRKRTPRSHEIHERAKSSLPMGVSSSFQAVPPYPLFISRAQGSHIWDYDGNEYADFHLAFGSLLVGHSHPVLVEALRDQLGKGSLYSLPSADTVFLAEEMVRRFAPIEQVRFCNSGTEATMDALRLARAHVGRDKIVKIEGSYHGHHDTVLMSTKPSVEAAGPADRPNSVPASKGIPADVKGNTIIAPYNDSQALERILTEHEGEVAADGGVIELRDEGAALRPAPDEDQPRLLQRAVGLADGDAARLEALGQLTLRGQLLPGGDLAVGDGLADPVRDRFGETALGGLPPAHDSSRSRAGDAPSSWMGTSASRRPEKP